MDMQVIDRLATIRAGVDNGPEAVGQTELFGDFAGDDEQVSQEDGVSIGRIGQGTNGTLGDDQNVRGGLRVKVTKRERLFVFVDDVGRDLSIYDLLENGHQRRGLRQGRG